MLQWLDKQIKRLVILACCTVLAAGMIWDGLQREKEAQAIRNLSACQTVLASSLIRITRK